MVGKEYGFALGRTHGWGWFMGAVVAVSQPLRWDKYGSGGWGSCGVGEMIYVHALI